MFCAMECVMAVQVHPRSSILVPIVVLVININLGPILPRFRDTAGLPPNFGSDPLGLDCRYSGFPAAKPLSNYASNYFQTSPTYTATVRHPHDGQTDLLRQHYRAMQAKAIIGRNYFNWASLHPDSQRSIFIIFTAGYRVVQSAVLLSRVVRLSVRL